MKWVVLIFLLIATSISAYLYEDGLMADLTAQPIKISVQKPEHNVAGTGERRKCSHPITVIANGVRFEFPRDVGIIQSGQYRRYTNADCSSDVIDGGIRSIIWTSNILSEESRNPATVEVIFGQTETLFSRYEKFLRSSGYSSQGEAKGFHVDRKNSELYVMPTNGFTTANGEPVLIFCHGSLSNRTETFYMNRCEAAYLHPKGFMLRYNFFRSANDDRFENSPETFHLINKIIRTKVDSIIK